MTAQPCASIQALFHSVRFWGLSAVFTVVRCGLAAWTCERFLCLLRVICSFAKAWPPFLLGRRLRKSTAREIWQRPICALFSWGIVRRRQRHFVRCACGQVYSVLSVAFVLICSSCRNVVVCLNSTHEVPEAMGTRLIVGTQIMCQLSSTYVLQGYSCLLVAHFVSEPFPALAQTVGRCKI